MTHFFALLAISNQFFQGIGERGRLSANELPAAFGKNLFRSSQFRRDNGHSREHRLNEDHPKWFRCYIRVAKDIRCGQKAKDIRSVAEELDTGFKTEAVAQPH